MTRLRRYTGDPVAAQVGIGRAGVYDAVFDVAAGGVIGVAGTG